MPYTLLFSRSIQSDAVMRITDVPITDKNVMIEVLSLISPFRRLAGYAYALRSDGITDYERSGGVTLPFGKNRVNFGGTAVPYGLEFFPRWGVTSGIISVYTGEPGPPVPVPGVWKQFPEHDVEFRLAVSPARIEYRNPIGSSIVQTMADGAVAAGVKTGDAIVWRTATEYRWANFFNRQMGGVDTEAAFNLFMASSDTIAL